MTEDNTGYKLQNLGRTSAADYKQHMEKLRKHQNLPILGLVGISFAATSDATNASLEVKIGRLKWDDRLLVDRLINMMLENTQVQATRSHFETADTQQDQSSQDAESNSD